MATWLARTQLPQQSWETRAAVGGSYEYDYDDPYDSDKSYDGPVNNGSIWSQRNQNAATSWTSRIIPT